VTDAQADILRVSDAERQLVVDRLRDETAAGRLTLDEFDERAGEAYAARTRGELLHVLRELPATNLPLANVDDPMVIDPLAGPPDLDARARRRFRTRMRNELAGFVGVNGTCVTVWALTGAPHFWPGWVLGFTGIGLAKKALRGMDPDRRAVLQDWRKQQANGIATATAS
jgi:hypothetical protein